MTLPGDGTEYELLTEAARKTIVFITLKLTGYIDWSWWWVLSPMWISAGIAAALIFCILAIPATAFVVALVVEACGKRRR